MWVFPLCALPSDYHVRSIVLFLLLAFYLIIYHEFWPCNISYLLLNTCSMLFWDSCLSTFHILIPLCSVLVPFYMFHTCSVLYVTNSFFWVSNSVQIATVIIIDCNNYNCIAFVIPDIPSWILKDDRKSRSLEPNIFKFNGVRLVFMIVIILMF